MRKVLTITAIFILWIATGVLTLWLLIMTCLSASHLYIGRSNAYADLSDIRVYAIWDGYLFKRSPTRLSVKFPYSESDAGRFRYRPSTGLLYEWPEIGGPDGSEIGVLSVENVIPRVAAALPERDSAYHQKLGADVVRLIEAATSPGSGSLGADDDDNALADENGDMAPAEGWELVRPSYGGTAPLTGRRSVDWTMLLVLAPAAFVGGVTLLGLRRIRKKAGSVDR